MSHHPPTLLVTEAARDELLAMLEHADAPDDTAARFVIEGTELRLTIDEKQLGDSRVDHAGRTVLLLEPRVARLLRNHQLDRAETDEGYGLSLTQRRV